MTQGWKTNRRHDKSLRWAAAAGYPEIFVIICKIMGKGETIWAKWMSILPWNAKSYESRSLCVMDLNVSPILGLWWYFPCVFISLLSLLLWRKNQLLISSSAWGACVHHSLWALRFTWEVGLHFSSSGEASEAWGGVYLPSSKAGWKEGMAWESCACLAVHGFIPTPPNRMMVELTSMLDSSTSSPVFWPEAAL